MTSTVPKSAVTTHPKAHQDCRFCAGCGEVGLADNRSTACICTTKKEIPWNWKSI